MNGAPRTVLPLFAWLSPGFPVGAYTYSHGLETAVQDGVVESAAGLGPWLEDLLSEGALGNDAMLLAAAWRAAAVPDADVLRDVNDLALALCASRERRLESAGQGNAFAAVLRAAWPGAVPAWPAGDLAYPVAFGSACAVGGLPLVPALEGFGLAAVQNLVSAAIRLGVVGQTDGQRVTAALIEPVLRCAARAATATLDDLGGCTARSDLMALRHETLYSRLFRS